MDAAYRKHILIATILVIALGVIRFMWFVVRKVPQAPDSTSARTHVLSDEAKLGVLHDLAASSKASAQLPMSEREQILQEAGPSSGASKQSAKAGMSSPHGEGQMEILHSLRYSE